MHCAGAASLFECEQKALYENYPKSFGRDFRERYVGVTPRRPVEVRLRDVARWEEKRT